MNENFDNSSEEVDNVFWGGSYSIALHILLPLAGFAILWGRRDLLSRLLLQIDRSCISVLCPSFSRRESLIRWVGGRLPRTWSSQCQTLNGGLGELWRDGSLLCTLINSAIPGACPNPHRHWKKPPSHGQALGFKYFGVEPVFTEEDFKTEYSSSHEGFLLSYLSDLQQAINKLPSKDEEIRYSSQYVARGMGLFTAEQHRKASFYLYSNSRNKILGGVLVYIRGPYGTFGKATVSPFTNLKTIPDVKVEKTRAEEKRGSFFKRMSIDLASYLIRANNSDKNDIPMKVEMEEDRAKVSYIPQDNGIYEINLICEGEILRGSPFSIHVIKSNSDIKDTFDIDVEIKQNYKQFKRKIISNIIDFMDEAITKSPRRFSRAFNLDYFKRYRTATEKKLNAAQMAMKPNNESDNNDQDAESEKTESDESKSDENSTQSVPANELQRNTLCQRISEEDEEINDSLESDFDKTISPVQTDEKSPEMELKNQNSYSLEKTIQNSNLYSKNNFSDIRNIFQTNNKECTKYIKNIVNSCNKLNKKEYNNLKNTDYELNVKLNNLNSKNDKYDENFNILKNNEKEKLENIILETQIPNFPSSESYKNSSSTSPICPSHIVPEVDKVSKPFEKLPLNEKRKMFAYQEPGKTFKSSFSTSENDVLKKITNSTTDLRVMGILGMLKTNMKNEDFTQSMPDVSSGKINKTGASSPGSLVKKRKEYWDQLSSKNSSLTNLTASDLSLDEHVEESKNFPKLHEKNHSFSKSVDDLRINKKFNTVKSIRRKLSITKLEDIDFGSIEDRKRQLYRDGLLKEEEVVKKKRAESSLKEKYKLKSPKMEVRRPLLSDRIKRFDDVESSNNVKREEIKETLPNKINHLEVEPQPDEKIQSEENQNESFKDHFTKAVNYFKNLEKGSKKEVKIIDKYPSKFFKPARRYSLESSKKREKPYARKGGSLNLSNISQKYSISNLYEDVIGNRNGSFRGIPNRNAVVNSLASLKSDKIRNDSFENEDDIKLNLFTNKSKVKVRKNLKSLFDINY